MNILRTIWVAGALVIAAGCTSTNGSLLDQLGLSAPQLGQPAEESNPLFVPLNKEEYGKVFEKVLHVLDNFGFDIVESNRADGRIETVPRVAPGLLLPLRPGSPDIHERAMSTLQTYRHRVTVLIQASAQGGYFIEVQVRKDLEDLPRPIKSTIGAAIFRLDNNVDRQLEVIEAADPGSGWVARGRDATVEQELLRRIKSSL
jgi:hypothetical protein